MVFPREYLIFFSFMASLVIIPTILLNCIAAYMRRTRENRAGRQAMINNNNNSSAGSCGTVFKGNKTHQAPNWTPPKVPEIPFSPPTTWTARTAHLTSCRCVTDPKVRADRAKMDPMVADAFHNITCSPLCRLPEELLFDIIRRVDWMDLQSLRRSCRLFLYLYDSTTFSSTHFVDVKGKTGLFPGIWNEPAPEYWDKKKLAPLLERDIHELCSGCRRARAAPDWERRYNRLTLEYMHCSGCQCDHPTGLFSAAQRRVAARKRICIGREGCVRLCNHRAIKWDDILPIIRGFRKLNIGNNDRQVRVDIVSCHDESHNPEHHSQNTIETSHNYRHPCVTIERFGPNGENMDALLQWNAHMDISALSDGESESKAQITPTDLSQHLGRFRHKNGVAESLAPKSSRGRLVEMNCFDPNLCRCLYLSGLEEISRDWPLASLGQDKENRCRVHPDMALKALLPDRSYGDGSRPGGKEQVGAHRTQIRVALGSSVVVSIDPCKSGNSCLQVSYVRLIRLWVRRRDSRLVTAGWYQATDPDSYNLVDDKESLGITWCRQEGCLNYFRGLRKNIIRPIEMHLICTRHCPS